MDGWGCFETSKVSSMRVYLGNSVYGVSTGETQMDGSNGGGGLSKYIPRHRDLQPCLQTVYILGVFSVPNALPLNSVSTLAWVTTDRILSASSFCRELHHFLSSSQHSLSINSSWLFSFWGQGHPVEIWMASSSQRFTSLPPMCWYLKCVPLHTLTYLIGSLI